jgi:hypothetical protein
LYSDDRLNDLFELELFLFKGVPETAEQMYEPEFNTLSAVRRTRAALEEDKVVTDGAGDKPDNDAQYVLQFNLRTNEVRVLPGDHL